MRDVDVGHEKIIAAGGLVQQIITSKEIKVTLKFEKKKKLSWDYGKHWDSLFFCHELDIKSDTRY